MTEQTPAWQDVVVPAQDTTTRPWWDATRDRRLLLQTCTSCRSVQHPPRSVCLSCMSEDLAWTEASGVGTVDSFTVVHRAPREDVVVPYVLARVRLPEGPILLTRLEGPVDAAGDPSACDRPVTLDWAPLADGRALPVFTSSTTDRDG